MRLAQLSSATLILVVMGGCSTLGIRGAIDHHRIHSQEVELGDTPAEVRSVLDPGEARLDARTSRPPEVFTKDGKNVQILYYRSGWVSDGLSTDDEFTPYIFEDGRLVAIGWTALGGPKNVAQRDQRSITNVDSTTKVYVKD
jgi:hypothetical protein